MLYALNKYAASWPLHCRGCTPLQLALTPLAQWWAVQGTTQPPVWSKTWASSRGGPLHESSASNVTPNCSASNLLRLYRHVGVLMRLVAQQLACVQTLLCTCYCCSDCYSAFAAVESSREVQNADAGLLSAGKGRVYCSVETT